jgi:hypothetical protein
MNLELFAAYFTSRIRITAVVVRRIASVKFGELGMFGSILRFILVRKPSL